MTDVALREYLEHKIDAVEARLDERFGARDHSLELQAKEYERRLTDLNHEQARLAVDRERYMPREIADSRQKDLEIWREDVNKILANAAGRNTLLTAILSVIVSIVVSIVARWVFR